MNSIVMYKATNCKQKKYFISNSKEQNKHRSKEQIRNCLDLINLKQKLYKTATTMLKTTTCIKQTF